MSIQTQISCPNCGTQIDVNEVLAGELEKEMQKKFQYEVNEHREKYKLALDQLKEKEKSLKTEQEHFDEKLKEQLQQHLKAQAQELRASIKQELQNEQSEQIALMREELEEKSQQIKELNRSKAEIERLKRTNEEMEEKVLLEAQKEFNVQLASERGKIEKIVRDQNELRLKEKKKQLEDLKQKLEEARRKAEQGSQQTQGEIQELAIELWLSTHFPFDTIDEIKKGIRGADCVQVVNTREIQNCGTIYYESKRTKEFQKSWIEKFKADIREKGADIGVLVTEVLPKELERMGLVDGIWICTYDEFKALSFILREHIVKLSHTMQSQENKSDKMSILYSYLTSTEFRMQIEAIVEGFTTMQSDLDFEKRALGRIWKQREKQIQKVLDNTVGMYGAIRGIAGNAIGNVSALELKYEEEIHPSI
ncbi:DUF2130 domain-containing protein [Sulfurovum sp. CS9]|uniref:DUF2130 domain-containing protein n=1 Tax=Sulfurovum sp. CS9 TaxID=3391146 RepID=UPI0039EA083B